ncbi:MAG: molybdopterin biosynthesis protein, partial [Litoreibacter sp.]|nr:molybdopterin biosynthesis protein [Litoreibacter sp.]
MFFGAVPLAEAEGAVLAHSVALPGRRLRKGASLTARDIQELAKAGLREVVVAKLGAGDVGEDIAATRLAQAMTKGAQGVTVTKAFTGRVNIVADAPGVALIDAKVVTAVNSCDPMITCATVPPLARLDKGSLIATIKIISYGVAAEDLARSEVAVAQANPAVGLHATKLKSACLIVTLTDAAPSSDKGVAA